VKLFFLNVYDLCFVDKYYDFGFPGSILKYFDGGWMMPMVLMVGTWYRTVPGTTPVQERSFRVEALCALLCAGH
jgi:hypothetical protein